MADQPKQASDKPSNKRRVRNPETFRERVIKATESSDKPAKKQRLRKAGYGLGRPFRRVAGSPVFQRQPFRVIGKALRLIGIILVPVYIRKSWRELRLVTWPTWNESRRLTVAVLLFAIVFGGLVSGLDYGLDKVFRNVLLK